MTTKNTTATLESLRLPELQARFHEVVGEISKSPNRKFLIRRIEETLAARAQTGPAKPETETETVAPSSEAMVASSKPTKRARRTKSVPTPSTQPQPPVPTPAPALPPEIKHEEPPSHTVEGKPTVAPSSEATVENAKPTKRARPTSVPTPSTQLQPPGPTPVLAPQPEPSSLTTEGAPNASSKPARGRFSALSVEQLQALYLEVVGRPTGSDNKAYLIWKIREAEKGRITVGPVQARHSEGSRADVDVKILPLRLETKVVEAMDAAWRERGLKSRMDFFRRALSHYLLRLGATDAAALLAQPESPESNP